MCDRLQCVGSAPSKVHHSERVKGGRVGQWQKPSGDNPVRTAVRFPMRLPVRMQTEHGEIEAVTENISANGLLFVSDRLPEIDSRVEFTIAMPAEVMGSATD